MKICCGKNENQMIEFIENKCDYKIYYFTCKICGDREEIRKYSKDVKTFKIIITGGREFNNYNLLRTKCDNILSVKVKEGYKIVIISGKTRGADSLGEMYAKERGYMIEEYSADWDRYGKRAGYIRNEEMAKEGDALIAFWDSKSRGTKSMIELAKEYNLLIRVVGY